jgi:hypothetical protein
MWTATSTDGAPDPEEFRRFEPPDNELPVAVPLNVVLARTDDVALALVGATVYSTGVAFDMVVRARSVPEEVGPWGIDSLLWGHGPQKPVDRLLFGVEFSDGSRVTNVRDFPPGPGPALMQRSGTGGQRGAEQGWWLTPLPPEGPLRLVVRGAALGIEETVTEVDAAPFRRAADDVVELWPWTPPDDPGPPPPPLPDVPPDSWFAGPS